jgi:hypothetical protein
MLLPNADHATVDRAKLEGYLLSFEHPQGRGKALFFARFGYWRANWETLRRALLQQALTEEATELPANDFGRKLPLKGRLYFQVDEHPLCALFGSSPPEGRYRCSSPLSRERRITNDW